MRWEAEQENGECVVNDKLETALERLGLEYPEQGVVSLCSAQEWKDSLIIGNGTVGVLMPGGTEKEALTFHHERLFMPISPPHGPVPLAAHLEDVRTMLDDGKWAEAALFLKQLGEDTGVPGHIWTDPFVPAFQLHVEMQYSGDEKTNHHAAYARSVDYRTGVATVVWESAHGICRREVFVSRADQVAVIRLRCGDGNGVLSCRLRLDALPPDKESEDYVAEHVEAVVATAEPEWLTYHNTFKKKWEGSLKGCAGALRVVVDGGNVAQDDNWLKVEGAREILILGGIELFYGGSDGVLESLRQRISAIAPDFDALLKRHAQIHGEMFERTRLRLDQSGSRASSEEMIESSDVGKLDPRLVQKLFDAGRYAVICSTGELPPALQGIWGATWRAPWSGDFTLNGNVQSAIACGLVAGIPEATLAFCNYLDSLMDDFRTNARVLYDARGIMVPSRTSTHGLDIHFRDTCPMSYWTAGAAWAAAFYYDYWLYTRDREFLEKRAVPFMSEAVLLYEDFLLFDENGTARFTPSYSPENKSPDKKLAACINATMDVAAVKELLRNLLALSDEVTFPPERIETWQRLLAAMPPYEVDKDGAFREWLHPDWPEQHNHRHASHLYPLYHVPDPDIMDNPDLVKACCTSIEKRLEYRRGKDGAEMSFGIVQLGLAATNLKNTALAYECVDWLCNRYWTTAFASTHNPGETFNVDICGGLPAVIAQMLLRSREGEIELLPCLPDAWPGGSVAGLCARGGFHVDIEWECGKLGKTRIQARADRSCRIQYGSQAVDLQFERDETKCLDGELKPTE